MSYSVYSGHINCDVNDEVYVYEPENFDKNLLNKEMIGVIESFKQATIEDWLGTEYLTFTAIIKMKNGKKIKIEDSFTQPFFRKYEFITIKDLEDNNYN